MAVNIESIYTRNTCIGNIYAVNTWIKYDNVGGTCTRSIFICFAFIQDIESRTLAGLRVILVDMSRNFSNTDIGVNDYYFWLFMELVFTSIDGMSC